MADCFQIEMGNLYIWQPRRSDKGSRRVPSQEAGNCFNTLTTIYKFYLYYKCKHILVLLYYCTEYFCLRIVFVNSSIESRDGEHTRTSMLYCIHSFSLKPYAQHTLPLRYELCCLLYISCGVWCVCLSSTLH